MLHVSTNWGVLFMDALLIGALPFGVDVLVPDFVSNSYLAILRFLEFHTRLIYTIMRQVHMHTLCMYIYTHT